jgi:hypothetical protein
MGQQESAAKVENEAPTVDREFIEKTAAVGLRVLDGIITKKIFNSVVMIHPSLDKQAKQFSEVVQLSDGEIETASKTVGALAEKYPRLFGYAPEITLGVFALSYGARVLTTISDIKKLAAEVKEMQRQQNPAANPPGANSPQAQ